MKFVNLIIFLAPLAQAQIWNISGRCSSDNVCNADPAFSPAVCKKGQQGSYAGTGTNGRTWCSPPGTKCTFVWQCK
ncbi:hypothetical protein BGZ57DRAFT_448908 [Hyaloscypha finlandica]|nr:hypothetical protein BGZ57DRAFT_448908 [Hyaloscypha finlandica]